jgi:hypothetical protein
LESIGPKVGRLEGKSLIDPCFRDKEPRNVNAKLLQASKKGLS